MLVRTWAPILYLLSLPYKHFYPGTQGKIKEGGKGVGTERPLKTAEGQPLLLKDLWNPQRATTPLEVRFIVSECTGNIGKGDIEAWLRLHILTEFGKWKAPAIGNQGQGSGEESAVYPNSIGDCVPLPIAPF
jgi:hypothetical protein